MSDSILSEQLTAAKAELVVVNAKILDMTKTGEEFEVGTSAGLKNRVRQVPYTALVARQKELLNMISELETALGISENGRISYVY